MKKIIGIVVLVVIVVLLLNNIVEIPFLNANENVVEEIRKDLGVPVRTTKVEKDDVNDSLNYLGNLIANETGTVSSKYGGYASEVYIENGDIVEVGQKMIKLDDKDISINIETIKINLSQAKLNYSFIESNFEKTKELYESGALSKAAYDKNLYELNMADYKVKEIEMNLKSLYSKRNDMIIKAPISGKIRGLHHVKGDMIQPGMPLYMIDDINSLYVEVKMPESDLNKLNVGSKVNLGFSGKVIESVVYSMPDMINEKTRIGLLKIGPIDSTDINNIILDSTVNVEFIVDTFSEVLIVEKNAVKTIGNDNMVYVIEDGKAIEKKVEILFTKNNNFVVNGDIKANDIIASSNLKALYDGVEIMLFEEVN